MIVLQLSDLDGEGWVEASAPAPDSEASVIAEVGDLEVKAGLELQESPVENSDECIHRRYRTGRYNVDIRLESADGQVPISGKVRVESVESYD